MSQPRLDQALARLDALVDWERRDRDSSMRRGLDPIADVLERLGSPQMRFRAVHVAGTKGKGTTSALVAAALSRTGRRTGLYTSPHVDRVQERIRIDGREIADDTLAFALERVLAAREVARVEGTSGSASTWFDVLTAAGFLAFAEANVEWAVVECGLGGRLDSTNVVAGDVCVVTSIDLEHTAVLGSTRAAIAREKVGILKRGSTLVTGVLRDPALPPDEDPAIVLDECAGSLHCPVVRPGRVAPTMLGRDVDLAELVLDELGERGVRDRAGWPVGRGLLDVETIEGARLPARLERRRHGRVPVVLDGAHVASSVRMVREELSGDPELSGSPVVVLALGRDKNAREILKVLSGWTDRVLCTTVASGPLSAAETLAAEAKLAGLAAETAVDPRAAYARALDIAADARWVLVIGSFHLAGAVRTVMGPESPQPTA